MPSKGESGVKKQASVLAAAGVVVATMAAVGATLLSSTGGEPPARDTVPAGQLISTPASTAPTSSTELQAAVASNSQKDTAVTNPQAPQTVQQPVPANEPVDAQPDPMPTGDNGAPLNPPPPPPAPPGTNPNGVPNPDPAPTT